ncbi:xaa-Pro aminopeptidase 3 [Halyomorpha halys]|uniref:xaa-Pro aminopeptidase 3 n=1 Tax=Halyomorpha halys TaxID=286706 RepID=UPI0006D4CFDA|nr:probable Xaa-Pro aminopeptidase 3 [Halyomorpha halys]
MKLRTKLIRLFLRNATSSCNTYLTPYSPSNVEIGRQFTQIASLENISLQKTFGQPTPESHPHLLKPGELVPGFKLEEFKDRRDSLAKKILSVDQNSNHVVLIPSSCTQYMTEKIPYIFRQNSDFRYLTGCLEPDSVLLMLISPGKSSESTLFVRPKNIHSELWEGPRTGIHNAPQFFGVDVAKPNSNLLEELYVLKKALDKFTLWYDYSKPVNPFVQQTVAKFVADTKFEALVSVKSKLHELRLIKSDAEQAVLKESAEIASRGIESAMAVTKPGLTEHHLFATVDYFCRINGAEHLAYPPVVATGTNANTIHYIDNIQQIKEGEMILMDSGCELHGYCSDITRTWPANGKFTDHQRTLYDVVLSIQLELIDKCLKQQVTLDEMFRDMCTLLGTRLKEAHILSKAAEDLQPQAVGFELCPHHVGHYLGMDVHDTGNINRNIPLTEGMLITIEPGVYVKSGCKLTRPEFHDMGIRIEDDVLIKSSGAEVISNAVKTPTDIEKMCQSGT